MEGPEERIGQMTKYMLLTVAILFDGAQFLVAFIPVFDVIADFILGITAIFIFGVWFMLLGVSYFSGSKSGSKITNMVATSVVELVPLLDALPGITIGVWNIISATRQEDKEKIAQFQAQIATQTKRTGDDRRRAIAQQAEYYEQQLAESDFDEDELADEEGFDEEELENV
jgi:hypothetical protein